MLHAVLLAALLVAAYALALPVLDEHEAYGVSETVWFHGAVWCAVVHQVVVWLGWRAQLRWSTFTKLFGANDLRVWHLVFMPLLSSRPILITVLAMVDGESLALPSTVSLVAAGFLALPASWALLSVPMFFGIERAVGGDHFRERIRRMPPVERGSFAYVPNSMYVLAFLGLWSIALFFGSQAALVAALFQHAYIQVHWLCTEKPDMELLYG